MLKPLFSSIPPERVGLGGEYDYNGLAKRVAVALCQCFQPSDIANLHVCQRGRVVILNGQVSNPRILSQAVSVIRTIEDVLDVELNNIMTAA